MLTKIQELAARFASEPVANTLSHGIVSISFDDFPASAGRCGALLLEEFGYRATYYVSGCYEAKTLWGMEYFEKSDLDRLWKNGHEIGCHTFSHLRLNHCSKTQIAEDLARNKEYLASTIPDYAGVSFAYPNGDVGKQRMVNSAGFSTARGIQPGINGSKLDILNVRAWPFYKDSNTQEIYKALDQISAGGWINIFTHDVSHEPSPYGCTINQLRELLGEIKRRNLVCAPVGKVAARIFARDRIFRG